MNIKTKNLEILTQYGLCDSYVAYPENNEKHPAIILFMDIYGPREYLFEMSKKIASWGFVVLLPNLFYRHKKAPLTNAIFPLTPETREKALGQVLPFLRDLKSHETMNDVKSFIDFLNDHENVKMNTFGVTGYCMGGGLALRTAANFPDAIKACARFHGGNLVTDKTDSVHLQLKNVKAEIYVAHADEDSSMTDLMIEIFEKTMMEAKVKGKSEIYRGSKHGFTMLDLPVGNEEAVNRHWINLEKLFKEALL